MAVQRPLETGISAFVSQHRVDEKCFTGEANFERRVSDLGNVHSGIPLFKTHMADYRHSA
ncbi:hypothetical protein OS12_23840 [Dickeya oryzae]